MATCGVLSLTIDSLRQLLANHTPIDRREQFSLHSTLLMLDELPDPLNEHAGPTHVTASAIVVGDRGVVLHKHKRLGIWLQPGGHIEAGEQPHDGAVREAREETGLEVVHLGGHPQFIHIDVHAGPRGHTHLDLRYLLTAPNSEPVPEAGESPLAAWFEWPEAEAIADAALIGALRAARNLPS